MWGEEDHRRLRAALAKLDPWSFWCVALEPGHGAEYAVVGTTGAFAIAICGLEGYLEPEGDRLRVGHAEVGGFREVKRAAKAVKNRLLGASTFTEVEPVICLTRAVAGTSRTVRGVRVVRLEDLHLEIADRERGLDMGTARRGAEALGRLIPSASATGSDEEKG
jgi:hypothetical protein